jgi:hypothetical protein
MQITADQTAMNAQCQILAVLPKAGTKHPYSEQRHSNYGREDISGVDDTGIVCKLMLE